MREGSVSYELSGVAESMVTSVLEGDDDPFGAPPRTTFQLTIPDVCSVAHALPADEEGRLCQQSDEDRVAVQRAQAKYDRTRGQLRDLRLAKNAAD